MSICIAIAVPDGIALSADSQTTWSKTITRVREKGTGKIIELEHPISQPISWSKMAKKLFEINIDGTSYAICVAGTALLNSKTMYSIFKSFESNYKGNNDYDSIIDYFVKGIEEELKKELKVEDISSAETEIIVEFILAGYENKDVSKPRIELHRIISGREESDDDSKTSGHVKAWSNMKEKRFGGCWIGRVEFITLLVDNKVLPPIRGQFEWLTLEDATDYTNFLVNFTCDYQRFAMMVPDCGGPIISAKLTPTKYEEKVL